MRHNRKNNYSLKNIIRNSKQIKFSISFLGACLFIVLTFFGFDDQEAIEAYLEKLQYLSEHNISDKQKILVTDFYINNRNRDPLKQQRRKVRKDFSRKKKILKHEWELYYSIVWPKTRTSTTQITNLVSVIQEKDYEAHHIVPINSGGVNQWWNISPLSSKNHHLLHESVEEKACFSHDIIHRTILRTVLGIEKVFYKYFGGYINKKGTNYYQPKLSNTINY